MSSQTGHTDKFIADMFGKGKKPDFVKKKDVSAWMEANGFSKQGDTTGHDECWQVGSLMLWCIHIHRIINQLIIIQYPKIIFLSFLTKTSLQCIVETFTYFSSMKMEQQSSIAFLTKTANARWEHCWETSINREEINKTHYLFKNNKTRSNPFVLYLI